MTTSPIIRNIVAFVVEGWIDFVDVVSGVVVVAMVGELVLVPM
jgi:hypothetical protein